ncbi:MAG TPA: chloride channel protein [Kofleriaceae bacterium]|nr:chloride channel protein [Kofleriaceae bacterium]
MAPPELFREAEGLSRRIVATIAVGLAAGGLAVGFRRVLDAAYRVLLGRQSVLDGVAALPAWACIVYPAVGCAVAVGLVSRAQRGNQGVGGVMEAVALGRGRISFRASVARATACLAAVATGASLGREGPIIQVGAGTGDAIGRRFALGEGDIRVLIAAGTAAGFAAAYGTPLAAVLFVAEVVTGAMSLRVLMPCALATVASTALSRAFVGAAPLYGAREFAVSDPVQIALLVVVGVVAGVVGAGFMKLLARGAGWFARMPVPPVARGALGGALAGAIAIGLPGVAGNGYETIHRVLDVGDAAGILVLLAAGKALATMCSVGSGTPGGVFTPALFLGAVVGRVLAAGFLWAGASGEPAAYALVGMAAICAATTHAPLMAAVFVFELSGDYGLALPLLAAAVVATAVARRLRRDSLYTGELRRRGVDWAEAPARVMAGPAIDAMTGAVAPAAGAAETAGGALADGASVNDARGRRGASAVSGASAASGGKATEGGGAPSDAIAVAGHPLLPPGYVMALVPAPAWLHERPITDVQSHPGLPAVVAVRRGPDHQWIDARGPVIVLRGDELLAAGSPEAMAMLGRFVPAG